ncbi:TPC1B, partial [Symbiodinium pilosum]
NVSSPRLSDEFYTVDHAVSAKIQEIDSQSGEHDNEPDSRNLGRMSEGTNPFAGGGDSRSPILMRLDMLAGICVLLNSLVMAVELELEGRVSGSGLGLESLPGIDLTDFFAACDNIFAVLYFLEICARIYIQRCGFFRGLANWFDIFLATTTCLDVWLLRPMALGGGATDQMILLRLARAVKSMRAIRMVRTLRLFRGLRVLVMACISFLPSLCWSMVLLAVFMIMGALMLGNLLQEFIANPEGEMAWREWVWIHYGTALRSMYTLYEITFAGNWPTYARPVIEQVSSVFSVFFLAYITLVVFAVIRVITAIFLKDTLDAASNDAEHLVVERLQKKSQYVKKLERVFQAIDETGNGMISQAQLSAVLQDPIVRAYFQTLEVDVHEGAALFHIIDNGDGEVTLEEFIDGILRCKGPARAIDQVAMRADLKQLLREIDMLSRKLDKDDPAQAELRAQYRKASAVQLHNLQVFSREEMARGAFGHRKGSL